LRGWRGEISLNKHGMHPLIVYLTHSKASARWLRGISRRWWLIHGRAISSFLRQPIRNLPLSSQRFGQIGKTSHVRVGIDCQSQPARRPQLAVHQFQNKRRLIRDGGKSPGILLDTRPGRDLPLASC
jgi:hypothetical protein